MDIIDAIILGVIQGLTEFLPVSSSGHLELAKAWLGTSYVPQESLLFTVVLHFATALSTVIVFRKDIRDIVLGILKLQWNDDMKFMIKIIISMIPAVIIGLFFEAQFTALLESHFIILIVGIALIVTGLLLFFANKSRRTNKEVTKQHAFIIGISQAIAILPGISRSGATIATSVLLGNDKVKAARFSFLMVIPLIFGKIIKDILSGDLNYNANISVGLFIGFLSAFITGLIACTWMINLVKKSKLIYFSIYCFIVGIIAVIVTLFM